MPAAVFNPLAAVIVHSQVPVNPLTFQLLEGEEALLVHGCRRQATRQEWRRYNKSGKLIVFVRHSPLLTYTVSATALDPTGENLGNYHPGRCLSDRALAFINGGRTPFQFEKEVEGVIPGKLILLNPSQEPGAGDATEVDFTIEHAFIDLDVPTYPGGGTVTPGDPTLFVEIPVQSLAALTAAGWTAILADFFQATDSFDGQPLTLTLYNGVPGSGGVAISDPLPLDPWTDLSDAGPSWARNHAVLTWLDASGFGRPATHLVWQRNNLTVCIKALAGALIIPAYYGVKAPVASLGISLTWSWTGASTARPARFGLRHLFGDPTTGITPTETVLTVKCYDEDPNGTGTLLDTFTVQRDAATWTLPVANEVRNAVDLVGTNLAPGGDWLTQYITVELAGVATLLYSNYTSGNILTTAGDPITLPLEVIVQALT